ncbi:hypothetical protein N9V90_03060, partial [Endozoicomonas sp.]|nr:hypothetical protein [Endozoicomonas sp.]
EGVNISQEIKDILRSLDLFKEESFCLEQALIAKIKSKEDYKLSYIDSFCQHYLERLPGNLCQELREIVSDAIVQDNFINSYSRSYTLDCVMNVCEKLNIEKNAILINVLKRIQNKSRHDNTSTDSIKSCIKQYFETHKKKIPEDIMRLIQK